MHNGSGGGVLSVIKNLLKYSANPLIENHIIFTINKDIMPHYHVEDVDGAFSQKVFYYSSKNNFYYTCKQLAKLLPGSDAIIIAHDWIELGMVSNLGLQNPVVQILHGDFNYYYELAKKNEKGIDLFICISPVIFKNLLKFISNRFIDIFYLNFPVPLVKIGNRANSISCINILFCVRDLTEIRKQFNVIIEIAKKLIIEKYEYFFTIVGEGYTQEDFFKIWPNSMKDRVIYLGKLSNKRLLELLPSQNIFLLPSITEGFPVTLIEAMKAGLVPIINNWEGAVEELVIHGETGFYIDNGSVNDFVHTICLLKNDRTSLNKISENCSEKANIIFDPLKNTKNFENIYLKSFDKRNTNKLPLKIYGSRLDAPWIPNRLVYFLRWFRSNITKLNFLSK